MASSSENDLFTSSEDMTDDTDEIVHKNSKGKEKMFESRDSTTPPKAHESISSLEVESNKGDKHVEWEINTNKDKVPKLGQIFASEEEAYVFYNAYGLKEGFSIRKDKIERRRNGKVYLRHFACSKGGHRKKDHRRVNVKKRRAETRTGCMARLVIRLNDDDTWAVKLFIADHNHPVETPSTAHLLRSQRRLQPSHVARIKNNQVGKGEAQKVMDYLQRMQLENPTFFYAVQVNSVNQMTNFFWVDARSIMDYGYFGDVVCFDTTFRTNKHSQPFAPFVGVNNHRQTILFGAGFLLDETTDSFVWLFKTFLEAMSGRKPNTILTDQCAAISKAINIVMPETHHRLCLRHIFQNAAKYLPHVYKDLNFITNFKKCIYNRETEETFLLAWNQMLEKYGLVGDKWLGGLFEFRKNWALVYGRNTFCGDMITTQRSESINSILEMILKRKFSLPEVLLSYEKVLASRRAKELKADFDSSQTSPALYINAPMLKQVAKEYTREVFEKFQKEFQKYILYNVENCSVDGTIKKYKVTKIEGGEECLVTFDAFNNEVLCSCKKFEFVGIQCKHVMKVLNYNNIHALPSQYIVKRWTKDARVGVVTNNVGTSIQAKPNTSMGLRYGNICRMAVNLATRGAVSEEAYLVAISSLEKALEDVEIILKETQVSASHNSIHKMNDCGSPMDVTLTLAQGNERDRPTIARMKSCLESGRGEKRSKINLHGNSGTNTDQPTQKKGRKGKSISVEGRDNDPFVNPSCPEEITFQESDCTHAFQEPYHASGLQQSSFLPYLGSFQVPFQCLGMSNPSIAPLGGTSTAHVELIQPTNSLGGHLSPPSIGQRKASYY